MSLLGSSELESQRALAGEDEGAALYREVASSVLWIEAVDASGAVVSTGSGFLVEGGQVLTSAHVVATGTPRVRLGPVALNARVERLDLKQDLAALAVEGQLALPGIPLANNSPAPGTSVWVIGNPQGLERTISGGTTSGTRTENGVSHLQLSAPVSPGSSGGPVLTSDGKVVGLVRMTIQTGQNLNFAVPVESIRGFLAGDAPPERIETFEEAIELLAKSRGVSLRGDDVPFERLCSIAREAVALAGENREQWLQVTSVVSEKFRALECLDEHLTWARKTYQMFGAGHEASFGLYISALMGAGRRAESGTPQSSAWWLEAVQAMEKENKIRPRRAWSFWADLAEASSNLADRESATNESLRRAVTFCLPLAVSSEAVSHGESEGEACRHRIGKLGFRHFVQIGNLDEARQALRLETAGRPQTIDKRGFSRRTLRMLEDRWRSLADSFFVEKRYVDASEAAKTAADLWAELDEWEHAFEAHCFGAVNAALAGNDSATLQLYRECIRLSSRVENPDRVTLGAAHFELARLLNERGLPEEALVHAQQAQALLDARSGGDGFLLGSAFEQRALALLALQRPSEALASAREALKLTDGQHSYMHFTAGNAAFDLRDFIAAERYFRRAVELDPAGSGAVFNVALCLELQGFRNDAAVWYRRYLKLDPGAENRPEVERKLLGWGQ